MSGETSLSMDAREAYGWRVGRWSRLVGRSFVGWLDVGSGRRWLDVGCGEGALSAAILETAAPSRLCGIDPAPEDVTRAREKMGGNGCEFQAAAAEALPFPDRTFDAIVAGLVFHFFSDPPQAFREMRRVAMPGAWIGGYVWDFGGEMQVVRRFWDAAIAADGAARNADPAGKMELWKPEPLRRLFTNAGLTGVEARPIDVAARFPEFATYWAALSHPDWTGGQYLAGLPRDRRDAIRRRLKAGLPAGAFELVARAFALRGRVAE
jgi:SAM-dependent methyltransferase